MFEMVDLGFGDRDMPVFIVVVFPFVCVNSGANIAFYGNPDYVASHFYQKDIVIAIFLYFLGYIESIAIALDPVVGDGVCDLLQCH